MSIVEDGGVLRAESDENLQKFVGDPQLIHYAGMLNPPRPGVQDCFQMLEFTHFKPGTSRNEFYHLRVFEWEGILWGVVSIPIVEKHLMESVAQANRLRVANGIPTMLSGKEMTQFPISNERVFTLENISGHPVYHSGWK